MMSETDSFLMLLKCSNEKLGKIEKPLPKKYKFSINDKTNNWWGGRAAMRSPADSEIQIANI